MDCATNIFCGSRALQKFCRRVVAVNAILNVAKTTGTKNVLIWTCKEKTGLENLV